MREQRDFSHLALKKARHLEIKGEKVSNGSPGKKALYKGSCGDCTVEGFALEHYKRLGWHGSHTENSVMTTLFALLFFDILFKPKEGAFESAFQSKEIV